MKGDKAYILGFTTLAFGYYLGYLWSPDYQDFIVSGTGHLYVALFGMIVLMCMIIIDWYYERKKIKQK